MINIKRKEAVVSKPIDHSIKTAILELVCLVPFLVPFTLTKSIDLQSIVTILTGMLSAYLVFKFRKRYKQIGWPLFFLTIYLLFLVLNLIYYHSFRNTFGAPRVRLGGLALFACVLCGLALVGVEARKLCRWVFGMTFVLAVISLPYIFNIFSPPQRLAGIFHQPDFLAVFLGIGLIVGAGLLSYDRKYRKYIFICMGLIYGTLMLTQTRAVIWTDLVILSLVIIFKLRNKALALLMIVILVGGSLGIQALLSRPFVNREGVSQSFAYRIDLQLSAIRSTTKHPVIGYGISNVKKALTCEALTYQPLKQTCKEGYYFSSSHNIYLDRIIEVGWIGGASFLIFSVISLLRGFRARGINMYLVLSGALVAAYYLSNPTDIAIELIFWVLLLRSYSNKNLDLS